MRQFGRLHMMAIPRVNLGGLRLEMSHWAFSLSWNQRLSSGLDEVERMLSTWTTKIVTPVEDWRQYMHHSHLRHSKPQCVMALWKVWFQIRLACFIP